MENIVATIIGAGITAIFPVIISPLIEKLKQFIAFSSFKEKRISVEKNSAQLEKAIASLDDKHSAELTKILFQLESEIKSLDVQDKKMEFQNRLIRELDEVKVELENKTTLKDKLIISLPIIPFMLNYETTLDFSSILKNFMPTKIAAENLKNEILKLDNVDFKAIAANVTSKK